MSPDPNMVVVTQYTTVLPSATAPNVPTSVASVVPPDHDDEDGEHGIPGSFPEIPSSLLTKSSVPTLTTAFATPSAISSIAASSVTGIPALPTEFADPTGYQPATCPPSKPFNSSLAILSLVAIILIALIFVGVVGYFIYLRCKGECPQCRTLKGQLKRWESGELKKVTIAMVREREANEKASSRTSKHSTAFSSHDIDLEAGFVDDAVRLSRAEALEKLEGNVDKGKGKATENTDSDVFFRVDLPTPEENSPKILTTTYSPPSPSVYSRAQFSDLNKPDPYAPNLPLPTHEAGGRKSQSAYSAYINNIWGPRSQEQKLQLAEAAVQSREYKHAQDTLIQSSASADEIRIAADLIKHADEELRVAQNQGLKSPGWPTMRKDGFF